MLVLSRKVGERILIGDHIAVTIVRVTGGGVRVGIEAPADMAVLRAEIKAAAEAALADPSATHSAPNPSHSQTFANVLEAKAAVATLPVAVEAVDPPSEVPPVRKPR